MKITKIRSGILIVSTVFAVLVGLCVDVPSVEALLSDGVTQTFLSK